MLAILLVILVGVATAPCSCVARARSLLIMRRASMLLTTPSLGMANRRPPNCREPVATFSRSTSLVRAEILPCMTSRSADRIPSRLRMPPCQPSRIRARWTGNTGRVWIEKDAGLGRERRGGLVRPVALTTSEDGEPIAEGFRVGSPLSREPGVVRTSKACVSHDGLKLTLPRFMRLTSAGNDSLRHLISSADGQVPLRSRFAQFRIRTKEEEELMRAASACVVRVPGHTALLDMHQSHMPHFAEGFFRLWDLLARPEQYGLEPSADIVSALSSAKQDELTRGKWMRRPRGGEPSDVPGPGQSNNKVLSRMLLWSASWVPLGHPVGWIKDMIRITCPSCFEPDGLLQPHGQATDIPLVPQGSLKELARRMRLLYAPVTICNTTTASDGSKPSTTSVSPTTSSRRRRRPRPPRQQESVAFVGVDVGCHVDRIEWVASQTRCLGTTRVAQAHRLRPLLAFGRGEVGEQGRDTQHKPRETQPHASRGIDLVAVEQTDGCVCHDHRKDERVGLGLAPPRGPARGLRHGRQLECEGGCHGQPLHRLAKVHHPGGGACVRLLSLPVPLLLRDKVRESQPAATRHGCGHHQGTQACETCR